MSAPMVLNIGWARAASTALRQNFLNRHPDLIAAGRGQPVEEGPAAAILLALKSADDREFSREAPGLRSLWNGYLARADRMVCLTDEELSIGAPGRIRPAQLARRCAELFPEARILAVAREQVDAIGSFYALSQRESFRNPMEFPDWLDRYFLEPASGEDFAYLYAHAATLEAYGKERPRSHSLVLGYHDLKADPSTAYIRIARWLGVSDTACSALPNAVVNASPDGHPTWTADHVAAVGALYEADNRILAADFDVALTGLADRSRRTSNAV